MDFFMALPGIGAAFVSLLYSLDNVTYLSHN
jgi:hypothetical protein